MENKNIQLSWSARDLLWSSPPFPAAMVYKLHLAGMATAQYTMVPELWTWSWGAQVVVVLDVRRKGVSDPSIPANKCRQIIRR
jgi:hypothetical protein